MNQSNSAGKPLDEFEDKAISAEPEIIERPGDSLISEVTASNADTIEEERVEEDEPIEETEEDDGISVDEYGTEWYEDEVAHGGTEKKVRKTGPSTTNEQRDIFQTRVNQRDEA